MGQYHIYDKLHGPFPILLAQVQFIVSPENNVCMYECGRIARGLKCGTQSSSRVFGMSCGAAMWSAPQGGAVTHSPSVGSRSGCRAELWAATSSGWNPGAKEEASAPLLESSSSLYWRTQGTTVFPYICVSLCHEGCHRCVSESRCGHLSVEVPA